MEKANMDIRQYMADHGVGQRALCEEMGYSAYKMCRVLKEELPEKEKEILIAKIDAICASRNDQEEITEPDEREPEEANQGFKIGDRVKVPSKSLRIGIVSDIWNSVKSKTILYAVDMEDGTRGMYAQNQLEAAPLPIDYSFNAVISGNVAIVTMMAKQGEKEWVVARGHAHILHDGEVGMAQAVSFASRRMFEALDTNKNPDERIYFKGDIKK